MKLIFLGSGSAFTVGEHNYHSNILLEDSDKNYLLIDCGSDARLSLYEQGLSHRDINHVYISHLHADHAGGLEWLAFSTKFDLSKPNKPTLHICETLVNELWHNLLSGGLQSIKNEITDLSTYFTVALIPENDTFQWQNIKFQIFQTQHVFNATRLMPSYGLIFKVNDITCLITTDTQFLPERLSKYYKMADIIFHECETTKHKSGVHSHYTDLVTLDSQTKAKIWLYHYNPGPLPDAIADGFRGFVRPGQRFDFSDKKKLLSR